MQNIEELFKRICLEESKHLNEFWMTSTLRLSELESEIADEKLREKSKNFWYVPDPNKQADLEKLREKTLLREFEGYVEQLGTHKKKLSHFRTEAIRAGFRKAWTEKDYIKIVNVGDRLPETVIQEDDKLLMYYDNAQIRVDM